MANIDTARSIGHSGIGFPGIAAAARPSRALAAGGILCLPVAHRCTGARARGARVLIVTFGFGVLGLIALAVKFPRSAFAAIAPASLVALATLCSIPGGYRLCIAARSLRPAAA
jgi:hypothetical protein